jgi:SWIM/SEC-C metal-binding protein
MSRYPHKNLPLKKPKFEAKAFETKKPSRMGSKRAPLKLLVNTEEKRSEVESLCAEHGWFCDINFSAENEEDISELTFLLDKRVVATTARKAGRNDPCPCGSGKKYKQCCAA